MKLININPIANNITEISCKDKSWDLRNDAEFVLVCYDLLENSVTLTWKFPSIWYKENVSKTEHETFLKLIFELVDFFEVDSSDLYGLKSDIFVLEGINDFYQKRDGSFESNDALTFEFGNGLKIAVKAGILRLEICNS